MNTRKAIITGSVKYNQSPLNFPKNDIDVISKTLKSRCKFSDADISKILHESSSEDKDFLQQIQDTCNNIEKNRKNILDLIVFYYSGHGVYKISEGKSFIQISDNEYISINEIVDIISKVNAKNKYFIIDACQSGGLSVFAPKGKDSRSYSYNSEGMYFLFGTTKNLLAFEPTIEEAIRKKINNSYYTHFIVEALNQKNNYTDNTISIKIVDDYASQKTAKYSHFQQIPFTTTQTAGYFPFGFWEETKNLSDINEWKSEKLKKETYSNNQELQVIEYLVQNIHKLFNKVIYSTTYYDNDLLNNLSQPAKDILNEKLNLKDKKIADKPLINGLFSSKDNYHFLNYILENKDIEIDLTLSDENNRTALMEAIESPQEMPPYNLESLFIRGYKIQSFDEIYLEEKLKNSSTNPKILENVAIALICNNLQNLELINKFRKIKKIVLTLLSFKINKVIGYKMNHVALANNLLNHHKDFSILFIKAMKIYKHYDSLMLKQSIESKVKEILNDKPYQETGYDDLLFDIFPELFNEQKSLNPIEIV